MEVMQHSPPSHSPPRPDAKRPKGILKNPSYTAPPTTEFVPVAAAEPPQQRRDRALSSKEITIENTQRNAGHRRSSSTARTSLTPASRRHSSQGADASDPASSQRIMWDEANLYLTEQERCSTMKINEPKTPYAKHYDPAEDPSDDELDEAGERKRTMDDIPDMSLGEPEEAVPEPLTSNKTVHVDDHNVEGHHSPEDDELSHLTPEEREKHIRFEQARKRHYEMRNVAQLLGHPEDLPDDDEDDDDVAMPPVPQLPNGSA